MTGELFSSILVVIGAVFCAISAFGLVRLPDVYLRSHAATKSATFGVLCLLGGGFLYFWFKDGTVSIKLLLAILFVFITSPVAGHLNGRAAYRSGVPLWKDSLQNELLPKAETSQDKSAK